MLRIPACGLTGDKKVKVVQVTDLGNLFTVALQVGLALLANTNEDMRDTHGLSLKLDELERVCLERLEVLGTKGYQKDDVVGCLGHSHGQGAVFASCERDGSALPWRSHDNELWRNRR